MAQPKASGPGTVKSSPRQPLAVWQSQRPTDDSSLTDASPRVGYHAPQPRRTRGKHSHVKVDLVEEQLLDMFSREKFVFFSIFELVLFLLVLFGGPELSQQARTKARWNKGGK